MRWLTQWRLNRTDERLAEIEALLLHWSAYTDGEGRGIPASIVHQGADLKVERARLTVRRARLEGALSS